ncbi:YflT domain-containing protein [Myceligenerans cantabricum]
MSMSRPGAIPKVPTLPAGDEVAAYETYLQAQQAVDYLSDNKFPVENVTIVGTDLRMVERVTGRLTYGRVALAGVLSGAWFGLFVGLLLTLFAGDGGGGVLFVGIGLGAGFGLLFSVLSYAFTRGRRDFTSSSQIVAATYAILCAHDHAGDARAMLLESPSGVGRPSGSMVRHAAQGGFGLPGPGVPGQGAPTQGTPGQGVSDAGAVAGPGAVSGQDGPADAPSAPRKPDPRFVTPEGKPRYGAMRPETAKESPDAPDSSGAPGTSSTPDSPDTPDTPKHDGPASS